jgi:hypothetical protein
VAGLRERDLAELKGNDARKVVLARLIWEKTTVSQRWIARRLRMGVQPTFARYCVGQTKRSLERRFHMHFMNLSKVGLPTSNGEEVSIFAYFSERM